VLKSAPTRRHLITCLHKESRPGIGISDPLGGPSNSRGRSERPAFYRKRKVQLALREREDGIGRTSSSDRSLGAEVAAAAPLVREQDLVAGILKGRNCKKA